MSTLSNPYLHFAGRAREAMTAYQGIFGGELQVMTYGDMGMEGEAAPAVMHAFLGGPVTLMASDHVETVHDSPKPATGHVALSGDEDAVLRGWFDALAAGGTVNVPLDRQPWGDVFGEVEDAFGVTWLVNISDPA
ncbi:VOC family protein [Nocardioides acrostichi]|uniref:VOC family protein n=1 Tax=Nocardioides acrostichi TaxID=2784339 RepID=A0A930UZ47_9ACTN|nr:VOC family protein [Nocardioides acrostichi]MBF4161695.1 VOC family protein [Nocardioides acrostichi]